MFGEIIETPVKIKKVVNAELYYSSLPASAIQVRIMDNDLNVVARGMGLNWNENFQNTPVMEWGHRFATEIVPGAMNPGQLTIQTMFFMHLNDALSTFRNLTRRPEMQAFVYVAKHEDPQIEGIVLDVFKGVRIVGQQGNFNAQSLYMRNVSMMYRQRLTGAEWYFSNPEKAHQAIVEVAELQPTEKAVNAENSLIHY